MWRSFSWADHVLAVQAGVLASLLNLVLRATGMRYCQRLLRYLPTTSARGRNTVPEPGSAQRLAHVINFGCRRYALFPPACLAKSLLQQYLLARRGVDVCVRLGARLEQGEFSAHAWVEYQGVALGETENPDARYVPFEPLDRP